MAAVAMNRAELLAFVREQFSAEEIWPTALIFDDQWEVETYLAGEGWHSDDDCAYDWQDRATDAGWIAYDLTLSTDERTVATEHDTQSHGGAIAYCTTGLCQLKTGGA